MRSPWYVKLAVAVVCTMAATFCVAAPLTDGEHPTTTTTPTVAVTVTTVPPSTVAPWPTVPPAVPPSVLNAAG